MNKDLKIKRTNTDFTDLAEQGVLLLNSALTVEESKPGSHLKLWQPYTNYIIDYISINQATILNVSAFLKVITLIIYIFPDFNGKEISRSFRF